MNLRHKTFLVIITTFVCVMGIGVILARIFFLESFRSLELEEITNEADNFHYLLDKELKELTTLTDDWAIWDDTYEFIFTADQSYIQSNLVESTFLDFGLSNVVYINSQNQVIYESAYGPTEQEFRTIREEDKQFFLSLLSKVNESNISGYYSNDQQLVLFSASPILTSQGSGPSRGILIFTQDFEGDIADHLTSSLKSDFVVQPEGVLDLSNFQELRANPSLLFDDKNRDQIRFASFITDINENRIIEVGYTLPRTIYLRGLASMRDLLFSIGATGILASGISILALEKGFLSRLTRLTAGIKQYEGNKEQSAETILQPGKDELSTLSADIYTALVNLSHARDDLADHLELEKLLVTISSKFINLPLSEINNVISDVLMTIGKFAGADRSYLLLINEDQPTFIHSTHEWCSPGTLSVMEDMQDVDLRKYNWWYSQMKSGKPIFLEDINQLPITASAEREVFSSQFIKSIANIPLFVGEKMAGALGFDAVKDNILWGKEITVLLEVVGSIIANAIDRQRHENRLTESRLLHQRRSEELGALRDTIADITSELEIKKLLQTILERSIKLLNADGGDICVFDEEENALRVVALVKMNKKHLNSLIQIGTGAAGNAALNRKPIIIDDYSTWDDKLAKFEDAHIRSAMVTPLMIGDRLLGTVGICHISPHKNFSKEDLHLLSLFAQHASIALDNVMLFERIKELARIDEVTGLLNRRSFVERAEYEINRAKRLNNPLALAMIDLDNFKQVNDRFSHQVGDKVLREVSNLLSANIRNIDIIGRFGGDEFMLLMPETVEENALIVLHRLKKILADHEFVFAGDSIRITASIGLASYTQVNISLENMISTADKAMYRAKNIGKNRLSD